MIRKPQTSIQMHGTGVSNGIERAGDPCRLTIGEVEPIPMETSDVIERPGREVVHSPVPGVEH